MKNRLLFIFTLACVFVCLFALSAGAEVVFSENNLDENGDIVADLLADLGNYRHLGSADITYTDTEGQTKSGKFYYETSHWTQRNQRQIKIVYIPYDFDMSQMISFLDKMDFNGNGSYEDNELIKLYEGGGGFKMYTYKSYENGTFTDTADAIPYIQAVSYSKYFRKLPDKGFGSKAPKLTTVTYNGREPIADTFIVSPLIDEIFGGSFGGDGSSLTANSIVTPFKKLLFEDREGSVSFGQYCFTRCIIEEIYFGKGTYNLANKERIALLFGKDYANGEGATLKTVILHKGAKIASGEISWNVGSYDVVVLGNESDSKALYEANCQKALPCAKSVVYNPCYYGHTSEDDNNCTTDLVCEVCGEVIEKAYESHDSVVEITYANGYGKAGEKHENCLRCGYKANVSVKPLFETKGYSTPENGKGDIVIGFMINYAEIDEYEKSAGLTLTYGAFAIAYDNIGTDSILNSQNAIVAEIDDDKYASFEMRISGFEAAAHKEVKLSIGAYVIDSKGEVSYLQAASPNEGESYHYITYNDIYTNTAQE